MAFGDGAVAARKGLCTGLSEGQWGGAPPPFAPLFVASSNAAMHGSSAVVAGSGAGGSDEVMALAVVRWHIGYLLAPFRRLRGSWCPVTIDGARGRDGGGSAGGSLDGHVVSATPPPSSLQWWQSPWCR
jgi:hypothetical protein